jgi:4-hydroxy-tetrahydrodipicolinate reductase
MIRLLVTGASGRMGRALIRAASSQPDLTLAGATARGPVEGLEGLALFSDLGVAIAEVEPTVVIDFTSAEASLEHARRCAMSGLPMVIGSTGFSVVQRAELDRIASKIPLMLSPNTSVGVNLIIQTAAALARVLGEGYDIEIVEAHHRLKKDAPSGTALRLAEEIARALGRTRDDFRTERNGMIGPRGPKEIGIQSVRGGDVVGDHTVLFLGEGERIELTHRASSRDTFALGALRAARWLIGQAPGLYDMGHVLGLST